MLRSSRASRQIWLPPSVMQLLACLCFLSLLGKVTADNITNPMHKFKSRPDLIAPIVTTELRVPELQTPGYVFLAPYQVEQEGPYIYDNEGNLVWSGFGASGPGSVHGPRVCKYKGVDHISYYQGAQQLGYGMGHGIIIDKNYRFVRSVEATGYQAASDEHEFLVQPDGRSALLAVYERRQYDLTEWGVGKGLGYILEGTFQEIDLDTGKASFEWKSLDHVAPSESFVPPGTTEISGSGYTRKSPWDYFHINSVDKNVDGDYLISARHVSCIYKISGKDGSIMWRLGGISPSFKQDFWFSSQHDSRFLTDNATHAVISLFDNASNGFNYTKEHSTGMVVTIDYQSKSATCNHVYNAPDPLGGLMSKSQGNTQMLPNGNAFLGWGNNAFFSEFTSNGTAIWHAWIARTGSMIYRCYKFNWTGEPLTIPALYTYSQYSKDMIFYISWNGATEVRKWSLYTGEEKNGRYTFEKTIEKHGFETTYHHSTFAPWSYIEALDSEGKVLSKSAPQKTYIPGPNLMQFCDDFSCKDAVEPSEEERRKKEEAERAAAAAAEEERHRLEIEAKITDTRRTRIIIFNAGFAFLLVTGALLYCGGKPLRRRVMVLGQEMGRGMSEVQGMGVRKYRTWKGGYRGVNGGGGGGSDTTRSW